MAWPVTSTQKIKLQDSSMCLEFLHPSTLPFPQRQTTEARRSDWVTAIMRLVDNWTTHHSDTRLLAQGTNMGKRRRAGFETGLV
jgi:hypothetical protein